MLIDHLLVILFGVVLPLHTWLHFKKTMHALRTAPDMRPRIYISTIAFLWTMALSVLALWWFTGRPFHTLGLTASLNTPVLVSLAVVGFAILTGALSQPWLLRLYRRNTVTELFPRTPRELHLFWLMAVTAGVTEEIIYRGYLLWYLQQSMPTEAAAVLATLWFAAAHAYQGAQAVLLITLISVAFMALYLWSGSLLAPMLLHATIDVYAGYIGHRLFGEKQQ